MNIQEYISSGIIESYVLGLASPEEQKEFELMCQQHEEILQARIAFENSLEKSSMENGIQPPVELKQNIFNKINTSAKVIELPLANKAKTNWLKYAVAVCLVLLAGSLYWTFSLQQKNKTLTKQLEASDDRMVQLEQGLKVLQDNPSVKMARMDGMQASPQSYATVYWDTTSHDVYLLVNNLPKPASDKQYQLWAFINNKPVDMGLLELTEKPLQLYRMKETQSAQAFAITLEKRGNGPAPQGAVYVMGKP